MNHAAGQLPRFQDWRAIAAGSVLAFALGGAGFLELQKRADESRLVGADLAELSATIHSLDALEWRVIATTRVNDELREALAANRSRATVLLASLSRRDPARSGPVLERFLEYRDAVNREIGAIERGQSAEAREIDEVAVDPAFKAVDSAVDAVRSQILASANRSARLSQFEALLALMSAMAVVGFMAWRAQGARREWLLANREQGLLRESQERLERVNAELAEASRLKSEFLATMSHEIRTPMNGVLGMLGLLLDTPLDPEQREFTETAKASGDALLTVINDILDFSKIEAGKLTVEPVPFDLRALVEDVLELLAARATERGVELVLRLAPGTPARFVGDPGRIRQVLLNLAGNAIKFTQRGHVLLAVSAPCVGETDSLVRIAVEDTGIGIPQDKLPLLFTRFHQVDASTTRRYGGTGLGLSIAKQLCGLMGGDIQVASVVGEGSVFTATLRLPLDRSAPPEPLPQAALAGVRALVVDDGEINRRVLQEQLSGIGMRAETAADGGQALVMLRAAVDGDDPYRVALVDHLMPDMDGETLGRTLRGAPEFAGLALVLCTSCGMRGEAKRFSDAGFDSYLMKPMRPSLLAEATAAGLMARERGLRMPLVTRHQLAVSGGAENRPAQTAPITHRVLVAEDNVVNQKVAARMLANMGCRVDIAANGREAVDLWQRLSYDLVLMDCSMPEMDGFEATLEIRRLETGRSGRRTPIVALTANAMAGDREHCLACGMDDFLSKPIEKHRLQEALRRNLGRDESCRVDRAA